MKSWQRSAVLLITWSLTAAGAGLKFAEYRSQFAGEIRYVARGAGFAVTLSDGELAIQASGCDTRDAVRVRFPGANKHPAITPEGPSSSMVHDHREDRLQRQTGIHTFERIRYRDLYPGIDLVAYGREGVFEYDFVVTPGADAGLIRLEVTGAEVRRGSTGELVAGSFRQLPPRAFESGGHAVSAAYRIDPEGVVSFELGPYDAKSVLVIDPQLAFVAGFGGSGRQESVSSPRCYWDTPQAIVVDDSGNSYIAGYSPSIDFPIIDGIDAQMSSFWDAFVTKLDPKGDPVYSTYIGGDSDNFAYDIAVDPAGSIVVAGETGCGFPWVNPLQPCVEGAVDGFVLKLSADGSAILFSTPVGGSGADAVRGVSIDSQGSILAVGTTESADLPVTPGVVHTEPGPGFAAKIEATGRALLWLTYLEAEAAQVAAGPGDNVYVAGRTTLEDAATTADAVQPAYGGGNEDAYVTAFSSNASALIYSTYLGGNRGDRASDLVVDGEGHAYVAGHTSSPDFPVTPGVWQLQIHGGRDGFIAKLNATGSALVYSTYLGGSVVDAPSGLTLGEQVTGLAIDAVGNAYVTGTTDTIDFPLVRPIQALADPGPCRQCPRSLFPIGCSQAFVTKLPPDAGSLVYSSYLGGRGLDLGRGIAADADGTAYVTGTGSEGFPWTPAPRTGFSPSRVFVAKIVDDGSEPPVFKAGGMGNAASFRPGLSPGSLASLFGERLTNAVGVIASSELPWPPRLQGTSIFVDGHPAPIYAVAGMGTFDQVNFQTPREAREGTVIVTRDGASAAVTGVPIEVPQPGLFLVNGGSAAAQHASDFSIVGIANRAHRGETIILYTTGLGPVYPGVQDGHAAPVDPLSETTENVRVFTDNGVEFEVEFAGLAPGLVGVYQLNVVVSPETLPGERSIVVLMRDEIESNLGKLWVQ